MLMFLIYLFGNAVFPTFFCFAFLRFCVFQTLKLLKAASATEESKNKLQTLDNHHVRVYMVNTQ